MGERHVAEPHLWSGSLAWISSRRRSSTESLECIVEFNSLTPQVQSRRDDLTKLRETASEYSKQLAWYDAFDPVAAGSAAAADEALAADCEVQLAELGKDLARAKEQVETIRPATLLGWRPQHWFSEGRKTAKLELARYQAAVAKMVDDKRGCSDELARAVSRLSDARESLDRYSKFDRSAVRDALAALEVEIGRRDTELAEWRVREEVLEKELEVPMRQLLDLRRKRDGLTRDLQEVRRLESGLGEARNSYERRQIHDKCEREFGSSSPRAVIRKIENAIPSLQRNVEKLERRLEQLGRRAALDVQEIIVDGSNLCYEGDKFIGLVALRALSQRLVADYEVTVVFDRSITQRLRLRNSDAVRAQLPGVKVHIVTTQLGADETILDAAQDPNAYVLSNDRFAEFPDKSAVSNARLMQHEIINGRILVQDLSIDLEFSN